MRNWAMILYPALILVGLAGCKKDDNPSEADSGFLVNASTEAKEALSAPVSFQLDEDNYARWEKAQLNLDRIPAGEFPPMTKTTGSAVERAVARLESSARTKRAIEAAGMSVRDFVLETVALAQAVQASKTGRTTAGSGVAAENFAFVERYRDRIRRSGLESDVARQSGDVEISDPNTAAELAAANADRKADSAAAFDSVDGQTNPRDTLSDSLATLIR